MRRSLTSFILLAVLVLGTGLGIGLGLSESPAAAQPTGVLTGGLEPWSEPSTVDLHLGGQVIVRRGGNLIASSCDVGGRRFGFRYTLPAGSYIVSANGSQVGVVINPNRTTIVQLLVTYGSVGKQACG